MENLRFLLERYKKGIATTTEKKALLDKLSVDENVLRAWLQTAFDKNVEADEKLLSRMRSEEIYKRILLEKSKYDAPKTEKKIRLHRINKALYKWAAAACITAVLFWSEHLLINKKEPSRSVVAVMVHKEKQVQAKSIANATNAVTTSVMEDGTKVLLSPNSSIIYSGFSDSGVRSVVLNGKAKFKVKHDAAHPFSVDANGIVITDLGTVFSVNSFNGKVQVKLFEGKVMIHSSRKELAMKDTYLKPGEQFRLSVADGEFAVSDFGQKVVSHLVEKSRVVVPPLITWSQDSLGNVVFSRTPLQEVFDKMSGIYNTHINYNTRDIKAMSFSGMVGHTDSLQIILKVICSTNDLNFKDSTGNIFIYK